MEDDIIPVIHYEPLYLELREQLTQTSEIPSQKNLLTFEELERFIPPTSPPEDFSHGTQLVNFLKLLNITESTLNSVRSFLEMIGFYCKIFSYLEVFFLIFFQATTERLKNSKFNGTKFKTLLRFFCPLVPEGQEKPKTICYKLSEMSEIFNYGFITILFF